MQTILRSAKKSVIIDPQGPFILIGEKINPTGRKKLAAALQGGDFEYIRQLALAQVEAGAQVLDVNISVPDLDDVSLMGEIVKRLEEWVDVPLCLDSPNPAALAAGLAVASGKPLINSVTAEKHSLNSILPLVKDREAAVIGLIMDDDGIPATAEARLAVAEKILEYAVQLGIPAEDIVIDPLAMALSADSQAGVVTLNSITLIREKLGVNINLGASNASHGLPDRATVNQAFMAAAMTRGATCSITDAAKMLTFIRATDLVLGKDEFGMGYVRAYRKAQALLAAQAANR